MYAAGRIPGSFFRREGRPSEDAILTCRLIDRPLRPSFAKGLRNEVQVVVTVMALDPDHLYDVLAINAASLSTQLAGLPFSGPIGGVRVALIEGQWVAFPTHTELEDAVFDMVVAGRVLDDGDVAIMMVEAEATDQTFELVDGRRRRADRGDRRRRASRPPSRSSSSCARRRPSSPPRPPSRPREFPVFLDYQDDVFEAVERRGQRRPRRRADHRRQAGARGRARPGQGPGRREAAPAVRGPREGDRRGLPLADQEARPPARAPRQGPHRRPRPHRHPHAVRRGRGRSRGCTARRCSSAARPRSWASPRSTCSAWSRSSTRSRRRRASATCTTTTSRRTPPVRPAASARPKRREIGHGALAERALLPVLPTREEFPYAIRQVSEALGSNGSTSMGSVCASTMSLLQRRCAAEGAGRRHRDGPDLRGDRRRDAVRRADRHPRRRGRVRRHGLQGRRHQGVRHRAAARHQARRHPGLGARRGAQAGPRRPPAHPRRHGRGHRRPGRDVARTRRGSSASRSRSTRSARSSAPRAR